MLITHPQWRFSKYYQSLISPIALIALISFQYIDIQQPIHHIQLQTLSPIRQSLTDEQKPDFRYNYLMNTNIISYIRGNKHVIAIASACVMSSFVIGIQTADDVQPVSLIEAGSVTQRGDIDGNGNVDLGDVEAILEIAKGYEGPTPSQLRADPNQDGSLTVDDALSLLATLSGR